VSVKSCHLCFLPGDPHLLQVFVDCAPPVRSSTIRLYTAIQVGIRLSLSMLSSCGSDLYVCYGSVTIRRNPNPNFGESGFGESGRHLCYPVESTVMHHHRDKILHDMNE